MNCDFLEPKNIATVQEGAIMIKSKSANLIAFHLFYTVLEVLFCKGQLLHSKSSKIGIKPFRKAIPTQQHVSTPPSHSAFI